MSSNWTIIGVVSDHSGDRIAPFLISQVCSVCGFQYMSVLDSTLRTTRHRTALSPVCAAEKAISPSTGGDGAIQDELCLALEELAVKYDDAAALNVRVPGLGCRLQQIC